jgi:hypothetical protein
MYGKWEVGQRGAMTSHSITNSTAPPSSAPASRPIRVMAVGAVVWSLAFAVVNLWVQYAALDPGHVLSDHRLGLAVLNGAAIALKLAGVVLAVAAVRGVRPRWAGTLVAMLTAAVTTLGLWGLAGLGAIVVSGSLTGIEQLAGGTLAIPAWTYPTFFLLGALSFAGPASHAARILPQPRRWILAGALLGPPLVVGAIAGVAHGLVVLGLLPTS